MRSGQLKLGGKAAEPKVGFVLAELRVPANPISDSCSRSMDLAKRPNIGPASSSWRLATAELSSALAYHLAQGEHRRCPTCLFGADPHAARTSALERWSARYLVPGVRAQQPIGTQICFGGSDRRSGPGGRSAPPAPRQSPACADPPAQLALQVFMLRGTRLSGHSVIHCTPNPFLVADAPLPTRRHWSGSAKPSLLCRRTVVSPVLRVRPIFRLVSHGRQFSFLW